MGVPLPLCVSQTKLLFPRREDYMTLLVLGATGGTGIELVRQAIDRGHSVSTFVRSPERLHLYRDRIAVKQGDLLNRKELTRAIKGHEAILSAFGPRVPVSKEDADLLHRFALSLTSAMLEANVKRLVVESSAFLFKDSMLPPTYLLGCLLFPGVLADATAMEQVFRQSKLDWTIVRPPRLTDDRHTGRYRMKQSHLPRFGFSISRADVADCFLRLVEDPGSVRKVIGVSD
jgi:putative NADH-flavin reductase